jgi:hypothetical protein
MRRREIKMRGAALFFPRGNAVKAMFVSSHASRQVVACSNSGAAGVMRRA